MRTSVGTELLDYCLGGAGGVCVGVGERENGDRGLEMNCGDRAQPDNKSLLPSVSVSQCQRV